MNTDTRILPAHWACPLINGDYSGLDVGEEHDVDDFIDSEPTLRECLAVGEVYFARRNDANNLAGDVAEFTFATA